MRQLTEQENKAMEKARAEVLSEVNVDIQAAQLISAAYRQAWKDCLDYQQAQNADLLAALWRIVAGHSERRLTALDMVEIARAAIAKAEGGEG